jgi:hypothetical protein
VLSSGNQAPKLTISLNFTLHMHLLFLPLRF